MLRESPDFPDFATATDAIPSPAPTLPAGVRRFIRAVRSGFDHAQACEYLAELPDYLLDDVGITRRQACAFADMTLLGIALRSAGFGGKFGSRPHRVLPAANDGGAGRDGLA